MGRVGDVVRRDEAREAVADGRGWFRHGLDAPGPIGAIGGTGAALVALGARGRRAVRWPGLVLVAYVVAHLWGSAAGKARAARRLLDRTAWRGDEVVLDVGCGHGVFLVEAARRLTTGIAVGVDLWSTKDQWRNRPAAPLENARRAGVDGRVRVVSGDARTLPFPDDSFDVVLSSIALHNIPGADDRRRAVQEVVRVLRPGGRVVLVDLVHTATYARELREAGMADVERSLPMPDFLVTARAVTASAGMASAGTADGAAGRGGTPV